MIACISYRVDELLILNIGMYIIRLPMDILMFWRMKPHLLWRYIPKIGVMITVQGSTKVALCIVQCPFLHQKNTKKELRITSIELFFKLGDFNKTFENTNLNFKIFPQ